MLDRFVQGARNRERTYMHLLSTPQTILVKSKSMEYNPATERNELLTQETVWTTLKNTMLSERKQMQKSPYCIIPCI